MISSCNDMKYAPAMKWNRYQQWNEIGTTNDMKDIQLQWYEIHIYNEIEQQWNDIKNWMI